MRLKYFNGKQVILHSSDFIFRIYNSVPIVVQKNKYYNVFYRKLSTHIYTIKEVKKKYLKCKYNIKEILEM